MTMANEKRLIDAKALAHKFLLMPGHYRKAEIDLIDSEPTVDAVEVVRCKDCKKCGVLEHNGKMYCKEPMGCYGCVPTEPDHFCSYGERRKDE